MTEQEQTALRQAVTTWHTRIHEADAVFDALHTQLQMSTEAPLYQSVWWLVDGYTTQLGKRWPIAEWLHWWHGECDMGAHPLEAGIGDGPMRRIATIDDLIQLILDDLAREEAST